MARLVTLNATITVKVPRDKTNGTDWAARYIGEAIKGKNRVTMCAITPQGVEARVIDANSGVSYTASSQQANP